MEFGSQVLTVGEISKIISENLQGERFQGILVRGEITAKKYSNGHIYMDVKDPNDAEGNSSFARAQLRFIIWRSRVPYIREQFNVGDVITAFGSLNYYAPSGSVSLVVSNLHVDTSGEGKALLAKKRLLEKLDKMGLLSPEVKKAIPRFVKRLAIVSSQEAAGYQDILNTLARRFPCEEVKLFPATVQGESAPASICNALYAAYSWAPDALIIGRGGGSKTDLSCFDDERVAMAIKDRNCPIITAIGHSIDVSVVDRMADCCAITPTDAANKINPSLAELQEEVGQLSSMLRGRIENSISTERIAIMDMRARLTSLMPATRISHMKAEVSTLRGQLASLISRSFDQSANFIATSRSNIANLLSNAVDTKKFAARSYRQTISLKLKGDLSAATDRLNSYKGLLASLSVEKNLSRGYALVLDQEGHVMKGSELKENQDVEVRMSNIQAEATIKRVRPRKGM